MGNVMIITFEGSEEEIVGKILAVLKEERCYEEIDCNHFVIESAQDISINAKEKTVYLNHVKVDLNHYEFLTFCYLAKHPGWVFTKEQIYEDVWGEPGEHCGSAVVNVISQIRRKLKNAGADREYIQTVVHHGYKFVP